MHRPSEFALALVCAALSSSPTVSRALPVPAPFACSFATSIAACPSGEIAYVVTVRDPAYGPLNAVSVTLDFSACPNVHFCPPGPNTNHSFVTPTSVMALTSVSGQAIFNLEAGGTCTSAINIYAKPGAGVSVLLTNGQDHAPVSLAGLDQDGDLVVTSADAAILTPKGVQDPTGDVNSDGTRNAADDAVLAAHLGHACPSLATPNQRRSWGGLKLIYR